MADFGGTETSSMVAPQEVARALGYVLDSDPSTVVEEIQEDGGRPVARPLRKVAAVAVIENPFAGRR